MRTTPRRRSPIARVEALETRNLLASASPAPTITVPPAIITQPLIPAPAPTAPAAPPTVANVQFEPLTGRVLVSFSGDLSGYNIASLTNPANYSLVPITTKNKLPSVDLSRPNVGVILSPEFKVTGVTLSTPVAPGQPQTLIVSVDDNEEIRFGTYRFTIYSAGITDNAGHVLDGAYSGVFPSGDGQPGSPFVAYLTETHSTILPAAPVTSPATPPGPGEVAPRYEFLPSTRPVRIRYLASRPAVFQLAGGNNIRLEALAFQFFPGTFRVPTLTPPAPGVGPLPN